MRKIALSHQSRDSFDQRHKKEVGVGEHRMEENDDK